MAPGERWEPTLVEVKTKIHIDAPIEVCFDFARDIDVHQQSVWAFTKEKAISGKTKGLIEKGDRVTFEATHFFLRQRLTSYILSMNLLIILWMRWFRAFKRMNPMHAFKTDGNGTTMEDTLCFEAPCGVIGWMAERMGLRWYMGAFLQHRNRNLKRLIEHHSG